MQNCLVTFQTDFLVSYSIMIGLPCSSLEPPKIYRANKLGSQVDKGGNKVTRTKVIIINKK
jgi:hypothetical protein